MGTAKTLWCSAASSITVPTSFPACVNTLGWGNEIQEMGKCSLNPKLIFLLLEIKKEKKGKEDPGKMHLGEGQAGQGWERSLLKGRRTIRNQLDQQGEPERAQGAAGRERVVFTYDPGQLGGRSSHLDTATVTTQRNYQQAWRNKGEKKSTYTHKNMGRKKKQKQHKATGKLKSSQKEKQ